MLEATISLFPDTHPLLSVTQQCGHGYGERHTTRKHRDATLSLSVVLMLQHGIAAMAYDPTATYKNRHGHMQIPFYTHNEVTLIKVNYVGLVSSMQMLQIGMRAATHQDLHHMHRKR
jgi:hypothetical protein